MTIQDARAPERCESAPALQAGRSVAIVHEWFTATGGSETVFRHMAELFPHAERFVLWRERDAPADGLDLRESWLARTPLRRTKALVLPLMPLAWRTLSRDSFDIVLSSSHAFAHLVKFGSRADTRYLSYVHSPARYLWTPAFDGRGAGRLLAGPRRALRAVDVRLSRHVHAYAANSREVRARIRRFWGRDAVVIYPPVDVAYFAAAAAPIRAQNRDYLLGAGRLIGYKNFDLVIDIARASGRPLVIAGSGPELTRLRARAARLNAAVTFEPRPSKERLRELYWGAAALVFPVHEDFGMVPVEAQACGTPVLGLRRGGLLETIINGETGILVDSLDPTRYADALGRLARLSPEACQRNAARFAPARFAAELRAWVDQQAR